MTSPFARSLIAAAIALLIVWLSMTAVFVPLLLFLLIAAAIAFVAARWLRPLYGLIASVVLVVISIPVEANLGTGLHAISLALGIGALVHLVANVVDGRKPAL